MILKKNRKKNKLLVDIVNITVYVEVSQILNFIYFLRNISR